MTLSTGEIVRRADKTITMNQAGRARFPRRKAESRGVQGGQQEVPRARGRHGCHRRTAATGWPPASAGRITAARPSGNFAGCAAAWPSATATPATRITTDLVRRFGTIAVEKLWHHQHDPFGCGHGRGTGQECGCQIGAEQIDSGTNVGSPAATTGVQGQNGPVARFVEVDPRYTSQDCSRCGARHNPGKSERYDCPTCGVSLDRDVNAAVNILRAGNLALAERQNGMQE